MSDKSEIAVSYDVSNEFFSLWLDERMTYSCALWEGADGLEAAQTNKLRWMHDAARVSPEKRVLDIGCGWGSLLGYLSRERGVGDATGITLSEAQHDHVRSRRFPGVTVECVSYRDYRPARRFDAAISIGMFEHIATPAESHDGRHVEIYRDYFRRVWEWTTPGAWFALQSVIGALVPRDPRELRELGWATATIFPGAITPRIEAISAAVNPYWEIMELRTRREHYERTSAEWLRRLRARQDIIAARWGEARFLEYERYLEACVNAFHRGYQSLAQLALRRIDSAPTTGGRRHDERRDPVH
jgi:cyclopropane-fatty-acyl-phospholipid synthase